MELTIFNGETEDLVQLLTGNEWPYHADLEVDANAVRKAIKKGYYADGRETFWIIEAGEKMGILIINDINDTIPLFDIRLAAKARGKGLGVKALKWLQNYLFGEKSKIRIEGYTRADNIAMRKSFTKAGFVKEGYLRNAWENADGTISDTVLYGAIYEDWKAGLVTPTKMNEVPY
ncbi:GNAT family N-acetyltransferase [Metasolibacillus fluoroglycofenilyticus]|uniref:GNAT family N-acetyltransferase n=1 Tax=Metasolibacillus fluoroglycofenilyticus TaxID=1239396 RepID=UPI000D34DF78|nr:GNAT family protein [Metasolibacillus fluoroglycofenilyticus]